MEVIRSALIMLLFGAQDVFEMMQNVMQNNYEELGAKITYAQRVTFKYLKKKYYKKLFYIQ